MSDGFVYFIQEEESGNIKIGFSEKHPKGRLKEFQTGNSNKLILLGYMEGTYQDESNLHRKFYEERIRNDNEWFKPSPRLKDRIKELLEESLEEKKSGIEDLNLEYNEGEKKNGKEHGQKIYTMYFNDGTEYVGEYKNGKKTNGYLYEKNGKIRGKFVNGFWIKETETWSDGRKYVGEYKNGKKTNGTYYDTEGNIHSFVVDGKDGIRVKTFKDNNQ